MAKLESLLVIGGAGFIGSNFVRHALKSFDSVSVLDKLTYAGSKENLAGILDEITFVEGDVRDREVLNELYRDADYIINLAAESHVDRSIDGGKAFVRSNVEGAFTAMDALRDHDIEGFLQMSTDEVYGSIESGIFTEDQQLDPSSPYSASKASADMFVNAFWETYDLPIKVARPTNVYGPRQHSEKLIPKFTLRALRGESLPLYGDGSNVRQWIYVEDVCRALGRILVDGDNEIYNVAGTDRCSNLEVTKAILSETGESTDLIEYVPDRPGHDQRYAIDGSKVRDELGFEASVGFEEGIARTVEWYAERM